MTEQELRALVRQAIARVQGGAGSAPSHPASSDAPSHLARFAPSHASHAVFMVPDGSDAEGPCIIEPAVMCNHCGYCKSLGH
jgi:hypothetical protein